MMVEIDTDMINSSKHLIYPPNFNPETDQLILNPDGNYTFIHQITPIEVMWQYWYVFAVLFIIITFLGYKYLAPKIAPKIVEYLRKREGEKEKDE